MCVQLCVRMQGPLKQKDGITTKCSTNYRKLYELSCNVLGLSALQEASEAYLIGLFEDTNLFGHCQKLL